MTRAILAVCCALLPLTGAAETLDELLDSRALESVVHPIAAEFVAAEGAAGLTEQQRATAVTQLKRALGKQTNPMALTMRGAMGMMNSPSMQRMRESAQQQMSAGGLLRSAVGINSATLTSTRCDQRDGAAMTGAGCARSARHLLAALSTPGRRALLLGLFEVTARRLGADGVPRGHHRLGAAPRRGAVDVDARQRDRAVVLGTGRDRRIRRRRRRRGRR
jgi:hypothetical protein